MTGCLKRQGRDTTLRTLKIESLLNLKRPRTRRDVRALLEAAISPSPLWGRGGCAVWAGLGGGANSALQARRVTRDEGARLDCQETTGRCCPAVSRGDSQESTD